MWKPVDYCSDNLIYKKLLEWIADMEEEFATVVLHNRKVNFAFSTES